MMRVLYRVLHLGRVDISPCPPPIRLARPGRGATSPEDFRSGIRQNSASFSKKELWRVPLQQESTPFPNQEMLGRRWDEGPSPSHALRGNERTILNRESLTGNP